MSEYRSFSLASAAEAAEKSYRNRKTAFEAPSYTKKQMEAMYPAGGFSVVGQISSGRDEIGSVTSEGGVVETVYAPVKMPHTSVRGYICVGENEYLAVIKDMLLLWLLWALILLLLLAAIGFGSYRAIKANSKPEPTTQAPGVIDSNAELGEGSISVPAKTETQGRNIKINGIAEMNLVAGQREQNFVFSNPKENPCYFKIEIEMLDVKTGKGTGDILYTSDLLPPGYAISKFTLNRALDPGEYNVVVHFRPYSFDKEQRPLNNMDFKTVIKAK